MYSFGESLNPALEIGGTAGPGGTSFMTGNIGIPTNIIGSSASPGGDYIWPTLFTSIPRSHKRGLLLPIQWCEKDHSTAWFRTSLQPLIWKMVCSSGGKTSTTTWDMTSIIATVQKIITAPLLAFALMTPIPEEPRFKNLYSSYTKAHTEVRRLDYDTKKESLSSIPFKHR